MDQSIQEIKINGQDYVLKSSFPPQSPAKSTSGLPYVIVRTYSAGVFAGYLVKRNGQEVELSDARRLWVWYGAATLSQLSVDGVSRPKECKFPCEVSKIELTQAIEIIDATEKCRASIASVEIWRV
jgi:hypothetical protein